MLIATNGSCFPLLNSQDASEQPALLPGAVTNPSAHLKIAGSTQPSHQPTTLAQPSLCKIPECQKHQLNCSRFWCYALNAKELPMSCFEAYTMNFLISFLTSLKCFVPKDFLAVKESLMPNLHICALFWLTYDLQHFSVSFSSWIYSEFGVSITYKDLFLPLKSILLGT